MAAVAAARKIKDATIGNPDGDLGGSHEEAQTSAIDAGKGADAFFGGLRERLEDNGGASQSSSDVAPSDPADERALKMIAPPKRSAAYKQSSCMSPLPPYPAAALSSPPLARFPLSPPFSL